MRVKRGGVPSRSVYRAGAGDDRADAADRESLVLDRLERQLRRIALDLHDGPMQALAAARLQAGVIAHKAAAQGDSEGCRALTDALDTAIGELQSVAVYLRPPALEESGLEAMLRCHLCDSRVRGDVVVDFEVDGDCPPMSASAQIAVFRIVQEALNNVRRHARAAQARVSLRYRDDCVECEVRDDGTGFDPDALHLGRRTRLGVSGMHERAELLGGTLDVTSIPGTGTTVLMRIPLWC